MPIFTPNVPIITSAPTIAVEGLPPGRHRFQLIVEDESGNRSQPSIATVTVLSPAPVITAVSPAFGVWGDQVVITGANFDPVSANNKVAFNGVTAKVESATGTQLTVRVPQPATTGLLKVTTGTGQVVSSTLFVIPRVFTIDIDVPAFNLALDSVKGNLWIVSFRSGGFQGAATIVSLEEKKRVATIFVDGSLREIAVASAGERRVCVVLSSTGMVSTIDLDSMQIVANIQVDANPIALAISPDGHWAYVLVPVTPIAGTGLINVIDMTVSKIVGTIPVGRLPIGVLFSPDGQVAVVNNRGDGSISLIDAKTHKVMAVIKVGGSDTSNPLEVAFSRETFPLWTANSGSQNASVITKDTLATKLAATNIDLGFNPATIAVTRDGTRAFLMGPPQEKLMAIVDTAEGQPKLKTIKMPGVAIGVRATPDDRGVIAIHFDPSAISVLETKTLSVRAIINLPPTPRRCLVTNDGKFAAVVCPQSHSVSIIEMESVLPTNA